MSGPFQRILEEFIPRVILVDEGSVFDATGLLEPGLVQGLEKRTPALDLRDSEDSLFDQAWGIEPEAPSKLSVSDLTSNYFSAALARNQGFSNEIAGGLSLNMAGLASRFSRCIRGEESPPGRSIIFKRDQLKRLSNTLQQKAKRYRAESRALLNWSSSKSPCLLLLWDNPALLYQIRDQNFVRSAGAITLDQVIFPPIQVTNPYLAAVEQMARESRLALDRLDDEFQYSTEVEMEEAGFQIELKEAEGGELRGTGNRRRFFVRWIPPHDIQIGMDFRKRGVLIQATPARDGSPPHWVYFNLTKPTEVYFQRPWYEPLGQSIFNPRKWLCASKELFLSHHFFFRGEMRGDSVVGDICIDHGAEHIMDMNAQERRDERALLQLCEHFEEVIRYGHHDGNINNYYHQYDRIIETLGPGGYRYVFEGNESEAHRFAAQIDAECVRLQRGWGKTGTG